MAEDDLIREVDEDLRHERLMALWRDFGSMAIGLSVVIVLATVASVAWQNHLKTERENETAALIAAQALLDTGKYGEAAAAFSSLRQAAEADIAALAGLKEADALHAQGKFDEALHALKAVSEDGGDAALSELAALSLAAQSMGSGPDAKAIAVADSNAFPFAMQELKALKAEQAGDYKTAADLWQSIAKSAEAPPSLRARAERLQFSLQSKLSADVKPDAANH